MKATETERGNGKYKTHDHTWNDLVHFFLDLVLPISTRYENASILRSFIGEGLRDMLVIKMTSVSYDLETHVIQQGKHV